MLEKDFDELTYWIDYDRPRLKELTELQKITYIERRLERVALIPIGELYASLMENKKDSSALLCFATCICSTIASLGRFYVGEILFDVISEQSVESFRTFVEDSGYCFKSFVGKYMSSEFTNMHIDMLCEDFRNGLIYAFAIQKGAFQHQSNYLSIKSVNGIKQLIIDPTHFYKDFINSVARYMSDLKGVNSNKMICLNFKRVFDAL